MLLHSTREILFLPRLQWRSPWELRLRTLSRQNKGTHWLIIKKEWLASVWQPMMLLSAKVWTKEILRSRRKKRRTRCANMKYSCQIWRHPSIKNLRYHSDPPTSINWIKWSVISAEVLVPIRARTNQLKHRKNLITLTFRRMSVDCRSWRGRVI